MTEDEIRASCVALMRTRIRLGMFDKSTEYDNIPYSVVSCPEHKAVSYQCAVKSMVLLKNNGILPLDKKSISTIAVIGPKPTAERLSRAIITAQPTGMLLSLRVSRTHLMAGCFMLKAVTCIRTEYRVLHRQEIDTPKLRRQRQILML